MKSLTGHEKAFIRYQKNECKVMLDWFNAIRSIFIIFLLTFAALVFLTSCGSREDDPAPVPTQQISAEFIGTWKVEKKMNVSGYIANTDQSLFVTVSPGNIKYKTINGGNFDGFGTVSKSDNADEITLSNGTRLIMFKTVQSDGSHNFVFNHSNSMKDDYLVKKQ